MSRNLICRIAVVCICFTAAHALAQKRQTISGDITGDLDAGEYVVKSTITIPEGSALNLRAGAVLYFEQLTGINVRGEFSAAGTLGAPVVLTSVNDSAGALEPAQGFDWNGVKTQGSAAALRLHHTRISHSVYGVSVRDPDVKAEFEGVLFDNNGYASVVRGEQIVPVRAGEPFADRWNIAEEEPPAPIAVEEAISQKPPCKHKSRGRLMFSAGAAGVTAAGIAVSTVSLVQMNTYFKNYTRDGNSQRLSAYCEEKIRGNIKMGAVGAAITGVGLGCLTYTLFF